MRDSAVLKGFEEINKRIDQIQDSLKEYVGDVLNEQLRSDALMRVLTRKMRVGSDKVLVSFITVKELEDELKIVEAEFNTKVEEARAEALRKLTGRDKNPDQG